MIPEIVVECGHWYAEKKITIATGKVSRISYDEGTVHLDSTKEALMEAAKSVSVSEEDSRGASS